MSEKSLFAATEKRNVELRLKQADAFALVLTITRLKEELEAKGWASWSAVSDRIRRETKYDKEYPFTAIRSAAEQAGVRIAVARRSRVDRKTVRLLAARLEQAEQQIAALTETVGGLQDLLSRRIDHVENYLTSKNGFRPAEEPAAVYGGSAKR